MVNRKYAEDGAWYEHKQLVVWLLWGELNKGKPQGRSSSNRRELQHWIAVVSGCGKKFTLLGKLSASVVKDSNSNKTTLSSPTMGS